VFGSIGAALGVVICLSEGLHPFLVACGAVIGALIGGSLASVPKGQPPDALRKYASAHRLGLDRNDLPPVTPLLLQPFSRTNGFVFGRHPSGFEGKIGLFNFIRPHRMYFNVTMQLLTRFEWPEAKGVTMLAATRRIVGIEKVLPVLLCERRYGGRLLDSVEEAARGLKRVHLESIELDRKYEVFTHPRQEPSWIRRLFSPSFVVWMAEELERQISIEIYDGWVTVAMPVDEDLTVARVEDFSEVAAEAASRIASELAETSLRRPPALSA
jgi:hypothetical protein